MENEIGRLVADFETGQMTRRQLVVRLGALMALFGGWNSNAISAESTQEKTTSTFEAMELNHIALRVTDIPRSRDFYIKHLGLSVAREGANNCFLTCGDNFVALFRGSNPGLDHYCYAVKDYDVNTSEQKLKAEGLTSVRRQGRRIYFEDPDGLTVQLSAKTHVP